MRRLGIALVPYSPLGRGILTGRFRKMDELASNDWRRGAPHFQGNNFDRNLALADRLQALAAHKGCTAAQLALAWLLARGPDIAPIPGTSSIARLEQNIAAAAVVLDDSELAALEAVAPAGIAAGERYAPAGMATVNH